MKTLKRLLPSSHIHYYAIGIGLSWLALTQIWSWGLVVIYIVYTRKLKIAKAIWLMMATFYAWGWVFFNLDVKIPHHQGIVTQQKDVKSGYRYTVKYGGYNYHLYTSELLDIGAIIQVDGTFMTYETDQFKGDFSPYHFHRSFYVTHVIYRPKITLIKTVWIPQKPHQDLKIHIHQLPNNTRIFVSSLVLGVFESDMKESISKVGITHLFVLSGLHVTVIIGVLNQWLWFMSKKTKWVIQNILLTSYLWVTLFPISLVRAVLQYILYEWLNLKQSRCTRLDAFSYTWIILLFINPYFLYNTGFQLTFLVSFLFIIHEFKSDWFGMMTSTFAAQTLVLPITSKITNRMYPIAYLVAPCFIPVFTYLLLPLSWLSLWPFFGHLLDPLFEWVMLIIHFIETGALYIHIPILVGIYALFYWILWGWVSLGNSILHKSYRMAYLVLFLLILPHLKAIQPVGKVTFLSVGQGDSTIIERPFGQCTVVIDAFGDVVDYLNIAQIQTIDYLIITHGDYDHHRETQPILSQFKVKQLVLSKFDEGEFEQSMRPYHPIYVKQGDVLSCGDIQLNILSPILNSHSSNENSIVIQTTIQDTTYLFTGDMGFEAEVILVNQNNNLKSDILKVGHHGSVTSTHVGFLNQVQPSVAIVSAGIHNRFGHPHPKVIERLHQQGIQIFQTNVVQTITIIDLPFYKRYVILLHKKG